MPFISIPTVTSLQGLVCFVIGPSCVYNEFITTLRLLNLLKLFRMRNRNFHRIWYDSLTILVHTLFLQVLLGVFLTTTFLPPTMSNSDLLEVASGNARFANKFYSALCEEETGNVFFSPISAHTVLSMVYQGAAGDTEKSFSNTLNVTNKKVAAGGYNGVMTALNNVENVTLHIANKIFIMKEFPLKNVFKKTAFELFLSEAEEVNFAANVEAANNINQWVEKKTNSKIKDLISADCLDGLTRLVLVNAVYFKGNWAYQFRKEATRTEPFYISNDDKVDCQMMHITKRFNYREDEDLDAKVLEMKYTNDNVSMVIILPNARDGIANLEKKLVNVDLSTITNDMHNVEVNVSLPKFKIETTMDLKGVLTKMGLGVIFDQNKADFSEISDNNEQLYVSKVIQKAFIEVNEEGAEAAAATGLIKKAKCAIITKPPRMIFKVEHPFIILLQNNYGNCRGTLFYGKIVNLP